MTSFYSLILEKARNWEKEIKRSGSEKGKKVVINNAC